MLRRTILLAFAFSAALAVAVSAGGAPNRATADPFIGTWNIHPSPGTPWANGGALTIRASTKAEVAAYAIPPPVGRFSQMHGTCLGFDPPVPPGPGQPPYVPPVVSGWYVATASWDSQSMGGCLSDRTAGWIDFWTANEKATARASFNEGADPPFRGYWKDQFFENQKDPEVTISGLSRKVEIQRGGTTWEQANDGSKIKAGDRIHTGWKAGATMTFPDGSTVVVPPMTLISIEAVELEANGQVKRIAIFMQLGEVRAQVHRVAGAAGDFQVKTPTTTASVRGTIFSVLYDGTITIVSVKKGVVSVKPKSGAAVDVSAGREVSSTATKVGKPVAIGKAGAPPGSVGPEKALGLLNSALAKGFSACKVDADSVVLKPLKRGWRATVKIVGARQGSGIWTITGKKVKPANKLAKTIARGCR